MDYDLGTDNPVRFDAAYTWDGEGRKACCFASISVS
jgi:hypothetical protein